MTERKKLSDILQQGSDRERLASLWKSTAAAPEFAPLPTGKYTFRILDGEPFKAKTGTLGYKLTLEVIEGDHEGRRAWHDFWITENTISRLKRELAKIGVMADTLEELIEKLDRPLPPGILISGKLVLRTADSGSQWNELKYFECIGVEKGDAFEPKDSADQADANGAPSTPEVNGPSPGEMFPFGANESPRNGDADFLKAERGGGKR